MPKRGFSRSPRLRRVSDRARGVARRSRSQAGLGEMKAPGSSVSVIDNVNVYLNETPDPSVNVIDNVNVNLNMIGNVDVDFVTTEEEEWWDASMRVGNRALGIAGRTRLQTRLGEMTSPVQNVNVINNINLREIDNLNVNVITVVDELRGPRARRVSDRLRSAAVRSRLQTRLGEMTSPGPGDDVIGNVNVSLNEVENLNVNAITVDESVGFVDDGGLVGSGVIVGQMDFEEVVEGLGAGAFVFGGGESELEEVSVAGDSVFASGVIRGFVSEVLEDRVRLNYVGKLDQACAFCGAAYFKLERERGGYAKCCNWGNIRLNPPRELPEPLNSLLRGAHPMSKRFKEGSRRYNNTLALASMQYVDKEFDGKGPPCVVINGEVHHRVSPVVSQTGESKAFAQLYLIDPAMAGDIRAGSGFARGCDMGLVSELDAMLRRVNPLIRSYMTMKEKMDSLMVEGDSPSDIRMFFVRNAADSCRRIMGSVVGRNSPAPTFNEVAVFFDSSIAPDDMKREICVYSRSRVPTFLNSSSAMCDPLCYVLLFPNGEPGYDYSLKTVSGKKLTARRYFLYLAHERSIYFSTVLHGGRLSHHYIVDAFYRMEGDRLRYFQSLVGQEKIRAETYAGLHDQLRRRADNENLRLGRCVILPSTFIGSPRHMVEEYHDALVLARTFGKPDLFITFTSNPGWKEVVESLSFGETALDRPDIVNRVFRMKLDCLIERVVKKKLFGTVVAYNFVIEFQSRGLPHVHLLLYLSEGSKLRTGEDIDKFVRAELPDREREPLLFERVVRHMLHICKEGRCLDDAGVCKRKFPMQLAEETTLNSASWPEYRRRKIAPVTLANSQIVDNSVVVSYSPELLLEFDAHINVHVSAFLSSIQYLYKYLQKGGSDTATVAVVRGDLGEVLEHDEVREYKQNRVVGTCEAYWRIFGFVMSYMSHTVKRLCVHLPGQNLIRFVEGEENIALGGVRYTSLTAWFELNKVDEFARALLYSEIPLFYVFVRIDVGVWGWRRRAIGHKPPKPILCRLSHVFPSDMERYCLRLMLLHVRGVCSYDEIRGGYRSFREVCISRGLLSDDAEWDQCLGDSAVFCSPFKLRVLFVLICAHCSPSDPLGLWDRYESSLIDDYVYRGDTVETAREKSLRHADEEFRSINRRNYLSAFGFVIPGPSVIEPDDAGGFGVLQEATVWGNHRNDYERMNADQKAVYDSILPVASAGPAFGLAGRVFYLAGSGGTGKTFVYNALIGALASVGKTVVPSAFTGIASCLLRGGMTTHSTYCLPVDLDGPSVMTMSPTSSEAQAIRNAALLIFDEATMLPIKMVHAIDQLLRDITLCSEPFGGKVTVFGGDFMQTLPIVGNRKPDILAACICNYTLWPSFHQLKLSINMRASELEFSEWVLRVGRGGDVLIPQQCMVDSEISLISSIFGKILHPRYRKELSTTCILAPTNKTVARINDAIVKEFVGLSRTYYSQDSLVLDSPDDMYDTHTDEFLHSLDPPGCPPHKIELKVGCPVMLIRNISVKRGLCNGTRLIITHIGRYSVKGRLIDGGGESFVIPRIPFIADHPAIPVPLRRLQLPIRLAFALTINKSQGQSFSRVGLCLDNEVFSHGQLYVACSRTRSFETLRVYSPSGNPARNIVYEELIS